MVDDNDDDGADRMTGADLNPGAGLHPLQTPWTLWIYQTPGAATASTSDWEAHLQPVGTFETVEMFWRYHRHCILPSCLDYKSNYHLFKSGIQPMWEDPNNAHGGKWIMYVKHDRSQLDKLWENLVFGLIGETIDPSGDEICGAVVSRRRATDRISIWNRSSDSRDRILALGKAIKKAMLDDIDASVKLPMEWTAHNESGKHGPDAKGKPLHLTL